MWGGYVHMTVDARRTHKKASDSRELKAAMNHKMWMLGTKLRPSEELYTPLTAEPSISPDP